MSRAENPLILFVCTGNTCRSPMAEALWNAKHAHSGRAVSAGVSAWSGMPAAAHAKKVVQAYGGNLDSHRARDVRELAEEPRWVLTMTRAQAERLVAVRPEWAEKIYVLTEFVGEHGDISDPVGQDLAVYQRVAEELDRLLEKVHQRLTEEGAGADASDRRD